MSTAFVSGAGASALAGYFGMYTSTRAAVRTTQAARTSLQDALGVARDGLLGPRTLGAAHALPVGDVLVRFLAYRQALYHGLPHASVFGMGWTRRLFGVLRAIYEGGLG